MYTLYIGNKNYSTWSLRGWLAVKLSGAPFTEVMVDLAGTPNPAFFAFSPTARVPALHDDGVAGGSGYTPLHYAAREGRLDCARLLLDAGAAAAQCTCRCRGGRLTPAARAGAEVDRRTAAGGATAAGGTTAAGGE